MGVPSKYWKLVRLNTTGKRQVAEIESAKRFFQQQFPELVGQMDVPDTAIQRQLLAWLGDGSNPSGNQSASHLLAERCLRCFISHQIEQVCIQLEVRFGCEHGFTRSELFPFVLDDALENFRDLPPRSRGSSQSVYKPLSIEILQAFDPQRASLSAWTTRLVKHHRELNVFLLEHGVYLVSDWAILNDTTVKQLGRILGEFHHLTAEEIQQAGFLLESYHAVYRRDRLKQRQAGAKGKCQPPSPEQLQQIAHDLGQKASRSLSSEGTLSHLQNLAERLRQYRIYVRGGASAQESLDRPETQIAAERLQVSATANESDEENSQNEFLTFYRQQFTECLDRALEQVTQTRCDRLQRKGSQKAQQFVTALELFHCQGRSMSEIAPLVELQAQYQVTRLLKLKEFRADTRQQMLQELRHRTIAKAANYASSEQLQSLEQQVEAALDEQIAAVVQEAETEASIASNRTANSLFAKRLCFYLDQQKADEQSIN